VRQRIIIILYKYIIYGRDLVTKIFLKKMPTGRQGRRIGPQYIIPGRDVCRALSQY